MTLTKWEARKAAIAMWIIKHICFRLSPIGTLHMCLDVAEKYKNDFLESIEAEEAE